MYVPGSPLPATWTMTDRLPVMPAHMSTRVEGVSSAHLATLATPLHQVANAHLEVSHFKTDAKFL